MPQSETLFIVGESRTNLDNAITKLYGSFYMAFEVVPDTGEILEFSCTHTLDLTEIFLRKLFLGRKLSQEYDALEAEIGRRYCGSSSKAVLVSLRDAKKRYCAATNKT